MDFNDKDNPFGYPLITYLWVVGLACAGGIVRYLNSRDFRLISFVRDIVTAGLMGLVTFWACQWTGISGPLSAVLIATSGLMGNRVIRDLEYLYRLKFGMRYDEEIPEAERDYNSSKKRLEDEL